MYQKRSVIIVPFQKKYLGPHLGPLGFRILKKMDFLHFLEQHSDFRVSWGPQMGPQVYSKFAVGKFMQFWTSEQLSMRS